MMQQYSVLMSVYYKEETEYLAQAIDSMLQQTVPPTEFVILCDGPLTPELDEMICRYKEAQEDLFKIIRFETNRGLGLALQAGVAACSFDLIARMDADDIALPNRLEKQLAVLQAHPDVCIVGGQIAEFNDTPERIMSYRIVPQSHEDIRQCMKTRNPMNHQTVLFRKEAVLKAGNYQSILGYEDYYLWGRMMAEGCRFANVGDVCCYVRVDEALYRRRGGLDYFRCAMDLEKRFLDLKLIGRVRFVKNVCIRFVGTVLIPDSLRGIFFRGFVRRNHIDEPK